MNTVVGENHRVMSGMRPTGALHLGHYRGVLKNWMKLQHEHDCTFVVVDWHALTTHYEDPQDIQKNVFEMVIDWLAVGINPSQASIAVQSKVPEIAELHLLLSMVTPLGWLERVPTYKEQKEKLKERDLNTYGFLGYPLLQAADILVYNADLVPVGEDQVPHIEMAREIARRFNYVFGREPEFEAKADAAVKKLGGKNGKLYRELRRQYTEEGNDDALAKARAMLNENQNITKGDRERLLGYLAGIGRTILNEPQPLLTETPKVIGLDGQKMSKSYGNTIALREDPKEIEQKMRTMPTDPARVRRTDPGNPEKCPVWEFHKVYSDAETQEWVKEGCTTAGIGCIECKMCVIGKVNEELEPIRERAKKYEEDPDLVRAIITDGSEAARNMARETMEEVRQAIGINYR
ncbi:MAG: tryptophan--tRNA ligase [Gammaproteobacteria bacterium]|nr:tryptophan--tRNA ligase [Gammaproteobacteria bacterium]